MMELSENYSLQYGVSEAVEYIRKTREHISLNPA